MEECIRLIDRAGGVAVLAHPCEYIHPGEVMERFVRLGGQATELCKYRYKMKIPSISTLEPLYRSTAEHCTNEHIVALARKYGLKLDSIFGLPRQGRRAGHGDRRVRHRRELAPGISVLFFHRVAMLRSDLTLLRRDPGPTFLNNEAMAAQTAIAAADGDRDRDRVDEQRVAGQDAARV